jgi:hypothetical protein
LLGDKPAAEICSPTPLPRCALTINAIPHPPLQVYESMISSDLALWRCSQRGTDVAASMVDSAVASAHVFTPFSGFAGTNGVLRDRLIGTVADEIDCEQQGAGHVLRKARVGIKLQVMVSSYLSDSRSPKSGTRASGTKEALRISVCEGDHKEAVFFSGEFSWVKRKRWAT